MPGIFDNPAASAVENWMQQNDQKRTSAVTAARDPYWDDYFRQNASSYLSGGPAPITADPTGQDQARAFQSMTLQDLHNAAQGDPNSYAQQQLRASTQQAQAGASSLGAAIQGQGAGQGLRNIDASQAMIGARGAAQAETLKLQEQQAAMAAYLQALQQQRGQDAAKAGFDANLALKNQEQRNQGAQFYLGQGVGSAIQSGDENVGYQNAKYGFGLQQNALNQQLYSTLLGAGGAVAGHAMTLAQDPNAGARDTDHPGYAQDSIDRAAGFK